MKYICKGANGLNFIFPSLAGLLALAIGAAACESATPELSSIDPFNWEKRSRPLDEADSLAQGSTYLAIYSEIYSFSEERIHPLTATISMRNISSVDTVFVLRADYYNTAGELIRTYFDQPIYIAPLETVEIIIDERDETGGTGANFIFEWATTPGRHAPHFEAVMISTSGQQGLSFTTRGIAREE